jgi:hypothetical protein
MIAPRELERVRDGLSVVDRLSGYLESISWRPFPVSLVVSAWENFDVGELEMVSLIASLREYSVMVLWVLAFAEELGHCLQHGVVFVVLASWMNCRRNLSRRSQSKPTMDPMNLLRRRSPKGERFRHRWHRPSKNGLVSRRPPTFPRLYVTVAVTNVFLRDYLVSIAAWQVRDSAIARRNVVP